MGDQLPLRDIHAALPADWWPPSPALWLLLGLAAVLILVGLAKLIASQRRARRRRALLSDLARLSGRFETHQDELQLARELSEWLRRLVLFRGGFDQSAVAGLSGAHWAKLLAAPFAANPRLRQAASDISTAPWRAAVDWDRAAAIELATAWVDHLTVNRRA